MKTVLRFFAVLAVSFFTFVASAVDINSADAKSLEKLPQIGPAKAKAIVDYRATNGPFKTVEDVKKVDGIGDKTFDAIKAEISIGEKSAK
ncbi:MAG: ComEA family DNA-binding protein [Panacagrimonas sp.]